MPQSIYVGLDLGSSRCHQTVLNADGALLSSRVIPTSEQHLRAAFTALGGNVRVHLESGELADWVSSVITPLVAEVIVSHSRTLAWIGKDSQKDDSVMPANSPSCCACIASIRFIAKPIWIAGCSNNWSRITKRSAVSKRV